MGSVGLSLFRAFLPSSAIFSIDQRRNVEQRGSSKMEEENKKRKKGNKKEKRKTKRGIANRRERDRRVCVTWQVRAANERNRWLANWWALRK